jgi:hypothetical protein
MSAKEKTIKLDPDSQTNTEVTNEKKTEVAYRRIRNKENFQTSRITNSYAMIRRENSFKEHRQMTRRLLDQLDRVAKTLTDVNFKLPKKTTYGLGSDSETDSDFSDSSDSSDDMDFNHMSGNMTMEEINRMYNLPPKYTKTKDQTKDYDSGYGADEDSDSDDMGFKLV